MRSSIRPVLAAVVMMLVIPVVPASAQTADKPPQAAALASWTLVASEKVPYKVRTAQRRLFPRTKVTSIEQSGSGATAFYRFKMVGKNKLAVFTAEGRMTK